MTGLRRYIVLPAFGFRSPTLGQVALLQAPGTSVRLTVRPALRGASATQDLTTSVRVLDSIHEDGPKLVEMSPEAELNLRAEVPGLKIVPVVTYRAMRATQEASQAPKTGPSSAGVMHLRVTDAVTGGPLPGASVVAFTDFRNKRGDSAASDSAGVATLSQIATGAALERLYVYPPPGYWGHYSASQPAPDGSTYSLKPIDLAHNDDILSRFCRAMPPEAGKGVKVAIIDTGVAKRHPALSNVSGGANMIFDETDRDPAATDDWGPAQTHGEHGTHVAGIVGGRGPAGIGFRGVAPGVELRSYRVFPNDGGEAQNYDIVAAMARAVREGCHIINLSLGGGVEDEATRAGIGNALDNGVLVVAAAGNNYRKPVSFPAAVDSCIAVSAYGRTGTFPPDSVEAPEVMRPFGIDKQDFFAGFSNYGPQIDIVGPGVGVVSTLPEALYGAMSGTSMACPAIVGFAAYLLSSRSDLQGASGAERARLWKSALYGASKPVGFGRDFEGFGLPQIT